MYYLLLIIFALLPSIIWLLFFLRKDAHPESNRMILKVFFWGILATLPVISPFLLMEVLSLDEDISKFLSSSILIQSLYFLGMVLVEEFLKYLVVSGKVLKSSDLDEPLDVMLYMIIAALGFAALENILYLLMPEDISGVLWANIIRFLGAVFGHALWSGTLGYFLALSFYEPKQRLKLLTWGFALAVFLHAAFNYGIMQIAETKNLIWLILITITVIGPAIFVMLGFKRLQKMKSICKIR